MGLAANVRRAREEHLSLTQRELGEQLGLDAITISRWERGVVSPRPQHLRELARLAKKPVSWFYAEDDDVIEATPA